MLSRAGKLLIAGAGVALLAGAAARARRHPAAEVARRTGWSVAAPDASAWITDFLNAAYFRRPAEDRDVDDLRLAVAIVTTRWHRLGHRRLRARDVAAFHRAFGRHRFSVRPGSPRGTLGRAQLLAGATRLLGDWFPEAYADDVRRAHAIAFESVAELAGYRPEDRLRLTAVGPLTPPLAPGREQTWHTYAPVPVPAAEDVAAALSRPETWPDYGTETGRFTALRSGGLAGQTFEIEVAAGTEAGLPIFQRGYVTVTRVLSPADGRELRAYVDQVNDGLARFGRDEPPAVPEGAEPLLALDLTTHEGHFMGRGRNRLLLFRHEGRDLVRAVGTWDPMPLALAQAYELYGREAQRAFWGDVPDPARSMLHQIAIRASALARAARAVPAPARPA